MSVKVSAHTKNQGRELSFHSEYDHITPYASHDDIVCPDEGMFPLYPHLAYGSQQIHLWLIHTPLDVLAIRVGKY